MLVVLVVVVVVTKEVVTTKVVVVVPVTDVVEVVETRDSVVVDVDVVGIVSVVVEVGVGMFRQRQAVETCAEAKISRGFGTGTKVRFASSSPSSRLLGPPAAATGVPLHKVAVDVGLGAISNYWQLFAIPNVRSDCICYSGSIDLS